MPWCEECARYLTPSSVPADGRCPRCGALVQLPDGEEPAGSVAADEGAPWHFKLLVVMITIYLVWRFVQLVT